MARERRLATWEKRHGWLLKRVAEIEQFDLEQRRKSGQLRRDAQMQAEAHNDWVRFRAFCN